MRRRLLTEDEQYQWRDGRDVPERKMTFFPEFQKGSTDVLADIPGNSAGTSLK